MRWADSQTVIGIDEVGRGAWAGPLLAVAVAAPSNGLPNAITDSKQLTPGKRARLHTQILHCPVVIGAGWVHAAEIDAKGLTVATQRAMRAALVAVDTDNATIYVDGHIDFIANGRSQTVLSGDSRVPHIGAASIVAKQLRDRYMQRMSRQFPEYGFSRHVGYGSSEHRRMLDAHGVTWMHRKCFRPVAQYVAAGAH